MLDDTFNTIETVRSNAADMRKTVTKIWADAANEGRSLTARDASRVADLTRQAEQAEAAASKMTRDAMRLDRADHIALPDSRGREVRGIDTPWARGEVSFFADLVNARLGDSGAAARIAAHDDLRRDELRAQGEVRTTTTQSAGAFIPQLSLGRDWQGKNGSGRVYTRWLGPETLPDSGMTIEVPIFPTLPNVGAQSAQGSAVSSASIAAGTAVANVVTFAGRVTLSRQAIERSVPELDAVIFERLTEAYDAQVEFAALSGAGSPAFLGAASRGTADGASVVTIGTADTGAAAFIDKMAEGIATLNASEFEPASGFFMAPRRWAKIMSFRDATGQPSYVSPIAPASGRTPEDTAGYGGPVGFLFGLPVWTTGGMSTTTNTNEDRILLTTRRAARLWESGGGVPQRINVDVSGGEGLLINIIAYGYAAFAVPKPSGLVVFSGAGLTNPFA